MYTQLIFDKGAKNTQWRKESGAGKTGHPMQKNEIGSVITSHHKKKKSTQNGLKT